MAFSEVTKGKPSQEQVDWMVTQIRNSLQKIDNELASHVKHLNEQTKTRHDGSDAGACDAMSQQCMGNVQRPPSVDVESMISPSKLLEARRFIDGLHLAISQRMNTEEGRGKTMIDNLSRCVQVKNCFLFKVKSVSFLFRG